MRSLLRSERPSTLARALGELGRITKTLYLLPYIDDETYRRRILVQLNRHEGRHALARDVFHGRRGELRHRYREGQEDQLGALGSVVNMIVLWNTLYMEAAVNHLRAGGAVISPEDLARLSPLGHDHINFLGRYLFALAEQVARGQLRPLNLQQPGELPWRTFSFQRLSDPEEGWCVSNVSWRSRDEPVAVLHRHRQPSGFTGGAWGGR